MKITDYQAKYFAYDPTKRCPSDSEVRKVEDVQGIARYIVANPLRAGLVEHIGDYPLWDAIWL